MGRAEVGAERKGLSARKLREGCRFHKSPHNLSCGTVGAQTRHNLGHSLERGENSR
jgi:hypothetical protein